MKRLLICLLGGILFLSCSTAFAQTWDTRKMDLRYYDKHPEEVLPDAEAAFNAADYKHTMELCKLHYVLNNNKKANALREKAQKCEQLTIEMEALASSGEHEAAQEKALAILTLNPEDYRASQLGGTNGYEWVDLGLSVKWAKCNVGASSPEDIGDHFAWGEVFPKEEYSYGTLKYCADTNGDSFTKYCQEDQLLELELSDDAANVHWGGGWRIPTDDEFEELITNCTYTWTIQRGQSGYRVTSKINGNSIFLPAAGFRSEDHLYQVGSSGRYWSSTSDPEDPNDMDSIQVLDFDSSRFGMSCYYGFRYRGHSVRPVLGVQMIDIVDDDIIYDDDLFVSLDDDDTPVEIMDYNVEVVEEEVEEEAIPFNLVEQKPSFNGGDANEFSKWVNSKLVYPEIAKENGLQGRVTLQFTVEADGTVSNVKVLRSSGDGKTVSREGLDYYNEGRKKKVTMAQYQKLHRKGYEALDKEAVRVVSKSPKWKPGKQRDRAVKVTYTFPVIFQLR